MERTKPLQFPVYERSPLFSLLHKAGTTIRTWRSNRRAAKFLGRLSEAQLRDCGIEAAHLKRPSMEVPTGLMQELMSMR